MTVGELLQKLGTDAIRDRLHTNSWVFTLFNNRQFDENTLITDVRFPNELDTIRKRGGIVLRIEGDPTKVRGDGKRDDTHSSETALDDADFDYTIHNTGTLDELLSKVDGFLSGNVLKDNVILR